MFSIGFLTDSISTLNANIIVLVAGLPITRIATRLAIRKGIAGFYPVTEQAIVAGPVIGGVVAGVCALVARIVRATHVVIAIRRCARLTSPVDAYFSAIAVETIVTVTVILAVHARIIVLVAGLPITRIATRLAIQQRIAGLSPIAEQSIVTKAIVRYVVTRVGSFVARIFGATHAVIAIRRCARLAIQHRITGLSPIAE
jgi:uncharacterized membrane protein YjjP (DUF1212 family)